MDVPEIRDHLIRYLKAIDTDFSDSTPVLIGVSPTPGEFHIAYRLSAPECVMLASDLAHRALEQVKPERRQDETALLLALVAQMLDTISPGEPGELKATALKPANQP